MTGIERLREFVAGISPITVVCGVTKTSYDREHMEVAGARLRDFLSDTADQIERERACDADTAENIRLIVGGVVDEMERHVSGVEGMEDSPVARWARELREAMGGDGRDPADDVSVSAYDLLPQEDRDAIAWVREQGGLDGVKKLLGWVVGHCSTRQQLDFDFWLSGRVMHELGFDEDMADRDEVERRLLARLMPEGMEWLVDAWPRFEDGEPVKFGDVVSDGDETGRVYYVTFDTVNQVIIGFTDETPDQDPGTWLEVSVNDGERVKRPAKVLDADGEEIRVGDKLYDTETGCGRTVRAINADGTIEFDGCMNCGWFANCFTHRAPVLAADGKPLREGETVWSVKTGREYVVVEPSYGKTVVVRLAKYDDAEGEQYAPDQLTHERPVADTWERLEEDATISPEAYCVKRGIDFSDVDGQHRVLDEVTERMARDLVRRAKALSERDAS